MDVTQVASSTTTQVAQPNASAMNADQFLTMLVAQLKNQDPLNPMDNAAVTTQMAQISTVQGIEKLNTTLQSLAAGFNANNAMQATSMVGHAVMTDGSSLVLANGVGQGGYQLDSAVDGLTLTVKSASGAVVHTAPLGAQDAGLHVFQWDGQTDSGAAAAPGLYSFSINATLGGKSVAVSPLMMGSVIGVTPGAGGGAATLDMGALGSTSLANIKHIF